MAGARHDCPGGCGRTVERSKLSCPDCWLRLPFRLRRAISEAYQAMRRNRADSALSIAHRLLLLEATAWYRNNPRRAS